MRVTYEPGDDLAYIYLKEIGIRESAYQHVIDEPELPGTFVLDFDRTGRLLGIEVLGAAKSLPDQLLRHATRV